MTTRKELQAWLEQFPEDAEIEVILTEDFPSCGKPYTFVHSASLDLTETIDPEFSTFGQTFEIWKNGGKVEVIQLGVHG
jgi:hypothetical protein